MKAGLSSEDSIPNGKRWDLIYTDDFEVGAFRIVIFVGQQSSCRSSVHEWR